jgi:surface protein
MFRDCNSLKTLYLSSFDTNKGTAFIYMFFGCYNLQKLILNDFVTQSLYSNPHGMFLSCDKLKTIIYLKNLSASDDVPYFWIFDPSGGSINNEDSELMANVTVFVKDETAEKLLESDDKYLEIFGKDRIVVLKDTGDINEDGVKDIIDVRLLLQSYINCADQSAWTPADLQLMDMNDDRIIDIIDVRLLLQAYINS